MTLGWSENILSNSQQAVLRPQTATTLPTPSTAEIKWQSHAGMAGTCSHRA